ncbi:low molecular weight protein-tyrosine-phosphatase [Brachybacterium sp.]|uniref:low molecular weight protein-tyrosine-phosphatase n=1 Tax=Brachybacterium sp. TaxID=1891286 RepID=UPI002ED3A13B
MTYRILAICTGNICRSPMAEYALRDAVDEAGLGDRVTIASAGTSGWESGNPIDPRAGALLRRHGIASDQHRAREMDADELHRADLVLALDHDHVDPVRRTLGARRAEETVRMVRDFAPGHVEDTGIRDPWYGHESDFDTVWEQIDDAVAGILDHVREALGSSGRSDPAQEQGGPR